ncbi:MAG: HAD hydrolase-like protein [bacterium]
MKFIFDFDDVLFSTKEFKNIIFKCLEEVGVSKYTEEQYYKEFRSLENPFSFKEFISSLLAHENKKEIITEDIYEKIMSLSTNLANKKLLKIIQNLGKDNCYIVTSGEKEFQLDKIKRANIADFFCKIFVVPSSKKETIKDICAQHKNEKVIFIDDNIKFFNDLDMAKCPNLTTVLYNEQGLEKLTSILLLS